MMIPLTKKKKSRFWPIQIFHFNLFMLSILFFLWFESVNNKHYDSFYLCVSVPRIPWAFAMAEACAVVLGSILMLVLLMHKHR